MGKQHPLRMGGTKLSRLTFMPGARLEEKLRRDVELGAPCKASVILTECTQHSSVWKKQISEYNGKVLHLDVIRNSA